MIRVNSIEHLVDLTNKKCESFRMYLNGGVFSRKEIMFKNGNFHITNCIDGSNEVIDIVDMENEKKTLIGKAIKLGAFYHEI